MIPPPPTSTLFPYTTLFRSGRGLRPHGLGRRARGVDGEAQHHAGTDRHRPRAARRHADGGGPADRKSTRLNSSHTVISYAVFCLKKKKKSKMKEIRSKA